MHKKTAIELLQLLKSKTITNEELIRHYLKRIQTYNKELGAFLQVYEDEAIEKAKKVDARRQNGEKIGKLGGLPIAIKDNIHIKGKRTTCGSKFMENYKAIFNATVIDKIESADGIIIGKTNLDEFAMGSSTEHSAFFPTYNPWDLKTTPGGSSGGSVSAVAARLCPLALGTDTGGSIRQPCAFTGLVGVKPTYGRVSRYGLVAFGSSFDQIGPISQTVEDSALLLEVMAGKCEKDATSLRTPIDPYVDALSSSIQGKTIGIDYALMEKLNPEVKEIILNSIEQAKSVGLKVQEIQLDLLKYSVAMYYILATAEASTNLARFDGIGFSKRSEKAQTLDEVYELSKHDGFGDEVRRRIMLGTFVLSAGYQDAYYTKAQKVRNLMIQEFERAYKQCDVILMPTTATPAFEMGSIQDPLQMYLQDVFTINANLTGMPAVSVPCGFDKQGMPIGLQFIGPQKEEARVLRFAHHFERATNLYQSIPPLFDKEINS